MIETGTAFRKPLELAMNGALRYLEALGTAPVHPTVDIATLRARMQHPLEADGVDAENVIADLLADVEGGIVGSSGPRFFAWVMGGSVPAALAADWLTSAWDQNAAQFTSGPAAAVAEEIAGAWLKQLFGLPDEASFAFVTGCQMAHATALAAARHALLEKCGHNVEQDGLYGAPPIAVITGDSHHGSVARAMRLIGMGVANIRVLPTNQDGRLGATALHDALHDSAGKPAIVVLQAGDINTGVFDDFRTLVPLAHEHGAWVHVDGASVFGRSRVPRTDT